MKWLKFFSQKRDQDALVGKYFLIIQHCQSCGASRIDGMGRVLQRVDTSGIPFYAIEPLAIGTMIRAKFTRMVLGHEMTQWSFYDSAVDMMADCREVQRTNHEHEVPAQVN